MLEFRILGPVEVLRDGVPLPLGGAKPRALIADLTLHANEVVSADHLIDDLWGEDPPETASHMLHVHVSRLRKTLEEGGGRGVLVTRSPGYVLKLEPPDDLDAARFEAEARRGVEALGSRPAEALESFDHALSSWRGPALEEFAHEAFAQPAAGRLEELRQSTHEHRAEALLALGRHEEALVELDALIPRFPLRERLRELQMLALYRSGRQGDALQAFQQARRTLADELGVDPGPALTALEQAILRHDPELDGPAAPRSVEPAAPPQGRTRRRAWRTAIALVVIGAVVAVAARVVAPDPTPRSSPTAASPGGLGPGATGTLQWSEVADPGERVFGGPGDQVILGGAVMPDGLLAVGYTAMRRPSAISTRDYDAAVWIGSGPADWRPVTDPAFTAPGNQEATDAVAIPGRTVVVGSDASRGDHDAAVWNLLDGALAWSRVDPGSPGMREAGDQWVRGVTWTGSLVVAVGYGRIHHDEDAAIWISSDARHWSLLTPGNLGRPGAQQMSSVTTFGDLVVAAGFDESAEGRDPAVWLSRDGVDWNRVVDVELGSQGDQQINAVLRGGPGLVAVGQETITGDENAAVWVSVDGRDWQRIEDPEAALGGPGSQQMSAVASWGDLIVAAGTDVLDPTTDAAVWTSPDGLTWTREPPSTPGMSTFTDYGRQGIRALLGTADGFVALGREGRGSDDDADVWIGRPAA